MTIMPIIPHFSNECLQTLKLNQKTNFKWPTYDEALLVEDFINLVIQVNGKKRGLIKTKKNVSENELFEIIKKEKIIYKYLDKQVIKKKIFIQNKLMNIIV